MLELVHTSDPTKSFLGAHVRPPDGGPRDADESEARELRVLRVLIVEDEFFIALDTKAMLEALGHTVVGIAVSAEQAIGLVEREQPDTILMDIRLIGQRDGIEAAEEIRSRFGLRSIFVTANTDLRTRQRAQAVNPLSFLEKPLTAHRLQAALEGIGGG